MASIYVDFDGTVADPSERLYRLYSEELARLGQPALGKAEYWALKRRREPERSIVELTCPAELATCYLAIRRNRIEDPDLLRCDRVLPGATEALQQLALSHRLVLVSLRTWEPALLGQIESLGLMPCFADVKACYQPGVPGWRAKAAAVATDPGFDARDAITVGDTEDDVLAGHSLGLPTVAVLSGIRTRSFLASLRPTVIVDAIAELPAWLAALPELPGRFAASTTVGWTDGGTQGRSRPGGPGGPHNRDSLLQRGRERGPVGKRAGPCREESAS